ncbi:hypothetical protein KZZ20_01890 [Methylacidiphilum fumariolicum]|uniref:Uncharacterized protein n=1 Tax=Methylacidiphilum fumariolicum (strain SolV) TaxID=1156937 RepID=I0K050_METFB|nr:hypothetical protein [Candidatus Methylacidiphilum fumarolicum]MBW6414281.1 hypothetical protein [Candidatus Methylacidiphilum fumarolicum]CCG92869.1 conserved hypothetical protein [Methylacidiphilum fumariolicum SolV]
MKKIGFKERKKEKNQRIERSCVPIHHKKLFFYPEKQDPLDQIVKESIEKITPPISLKKNILKAINDFEDNSSQK